MESPSDRPSKSMYTILARMSMEWEVEMHLVGTSCISKKSETLLGIHINIHISEMYTHERIVRVSVLWHILKRISIKCPSRDPTHSKSRAGELTV